MTKYKPKKRSGTASDKDDFAACVKQLYTTDAGLSFHPANAFLSCMREACYGRKLGRTDARRCASLEDLKADTRQIRIITNDVDVSTLPQDQAAEYQATLAAFRKTLGKDGVVLVPTKARAESRSSGGRGKKAAVAAERASGPGLAAGCPRPAGRNRLPE